MILLYHKIAEENKSMWWVSADAFYRQLVQLSNKKVVYLDDYDPSNPDHVVITFDGIYDNVAKYALPLLEKFGYPFELFFTSEWLGKDSRFDEAEPIANFLDQKELKALTKRGGRLQWHTRTHRDLTKLKKSELIKEIKWPKKMESLDPTGLKWFAYPYGKSDSLSESLVSEIFKGALGTDKGSFESRFLWPRKTVTENTQLAPEKVSVIIPCYNYASFLVEAIESVLRQTYVPDEIILSDDNSNDHSLHIMQVYKERYPNLIKVNHNSENLGIEKHFAKAVKMTSGDYVCFLGADNRMPGNYIEKLYVSLQKDPKSAIAYTDFALFGSRAEIAHKGFYKKYQGSKIANNTYAINFPKFNLKQKQIILNGERNFIHGSSMYRRKAYNQVGGYKSRKHGPEDYTLFQAMIKAGWNAVKVENLRLEYRQHSSEQANNQFSYFSELSFLRNEFTKIQEIKSLLANVQQENKAMHAEIEKMAADFKEINEARIRTEKELAKIKNSLAWRMLRRANKIRRKFIQ